MDFVDAVRGRRSIRKFKTAAPNQDLFEKAAELAKWSAVAPAHRRWVYHVVTTEGLREEIASLANANTMTISNLLMQESDSHKALDLYEGLANAPVFVAVTAPETENSFEDLAQRTWFGMELQLYMLALHILGLGASSVLLPPWLAKELVHLLGAEPHYLLALMAVGYPDEEPEKPTREPAGTVFHW